jgi:hypothetical protein
LVWFPISATFYHGDTTEQPGFYFPTHSNTGRMVMKKLLVCMAALSCLLVVGSSNTMAQCYRGGSGFGISVNYGNGYNNFGSGYSRGFRQPYYGGYGSGYYGGGYPAYRSVQVYSTPIYGGGYHGGGYNRGFGGYGGGGYGHHHHH